jgi:UDP-2-acetamido-2,6-beta-L-arabino-hexul-4-ose reductase
MKNILITGANGFIGKNLAAHLQGKEGINIIKIDLDDSTQKLQESLKKSDWIFHLAGVNRPQTTDEFNQVNAGLTETIIKYLQSIDHNPNIVFSSSTQAEQDNPYGLSKKRAEDLLIDHADKTSSQIFIFQLPGVFGKWCKPNYNSVIATFCHNIAHNLDVTIHDKETQLTVTYIDDIMATWLTLLDQDNHNNKQHLYKIPAEYTIQLGALAEQIQKFKKMRMDLFIPDLSDKFTRYLYSTYLSYLDEDDFAYSLEPRTDDRGDLTELFKSHHFGQVFFSSTKPGIVRGNHYHHTKVEKFVVVTGKALIKFRHILEDKVISYEISGKDYKVVDIPPGFTHSIKNIGKEEMIVLFWANEPFDYEKPDTDYFKVEQ